MSVGPKPRTATGTACEGVQDQGGCLECPFKAKGGEQRLLLKGAIDSSRSREVSVDVYALYGLSRFPNEAHVGFRTTVIESFSQTATLNGSVLACFYCDFWTSVQLFCKSTTFPYSVSSFIKVTIESFERFPVVPTPSKSVSNNSRTPDAAMSSRRSTFGWTPLNAPHETCRWVQCQLDRLRDCCSTSDVDEVLDTFPSGLCQTYDRILSDIDKKPFDGQIVKSTLRWLLGTLKSLSLPSLVVIVAFDIYQEGTRAVCHIQREFLPDTDVLGICRVLLVSRNTFLVNTSIWALVVTITSHRPSSTIIWKSFVPTISVLIRWSPNVMTSCSTSYKITWWTSGGIS
ncbi:hypothetical protein BU15DRAFT_69433 [Melanogaster broomeanus]|nr:hypothetical protein BU15DRAFT_69433 [Melanogaster broomeanus]